MPGGGLCATMMYTEEHTKPRVDPILLPAGADAVSLCQELGSEPVLSPRKQLARGHFLWFPWKPGAL